MISRELQINFVSFSGCGSSFDSYNLSIDSYGLRPLVNNNASQASFNASNASFNTSMDQNYGQSNHMSSSSSLLPNSDAVAYMRSGDVGSNFISSKMVTNSPSSSPSLNYTNQGAYADQQMLVHHRPSYSPGGFENRALTVEPGKNYNSLLDSNERAQLGLMTRKSLEDHLIKKQFDAQLNKVSNQNEHQQQPSHRQSTRSNNIILAQIQTSREIAKSCRDMTSSNETFY